MKGSKVKKPTRVANKSIESEEKKSMEEVNRESTLKIPQIIGSLELIAQF